MKRSSGIGTCSFLLIFSLSIFSGNVALAQAATAASPAQSGISEPAAQPASAKDSAAAPEAGAEAKKASDSESETEAFRHSPVVQKLANAFHLPIETAARLFEFLNFGILAFSVLYVIFKYVPKAFRNRNAAIQKQLVDARSATEVASERLKGVEARLSRLDEEIAAIRKEVEQESLKDEARIKATVEEERKRIVEAAGHEIDAAASAAQRELKRFAAELAVQRATSELSLTPETDRMLVQNFARSLGKENQGGRN
ncbi:MAG TPA: ATP synthase F0 subunit B [Acidisarcina sp.]|nr:ATP synthase F0 subunit B [Acidisarcina sp.]